MYSVFKVRIWLYQPYQPERIFQLVSPVKLLAFPAASDFHSYKERLALLLKRDFHSLYFCCKDAGGRLSFHTVSGIVFSAARVLTIVFGMGTGVSPGRIATSKFMQLFLR